MSTADIYDASVKTLKANAEVLADTQNALLEHIFEGTSISAFKPIFEDNTLDTLSIPEGITTIANRAFMGRGVKHLTIASTVESIGYQAFSAFSVIPTRTVAWPAYTILESITFAEPSALKMIGESAFATFGIPSLTLPEGVEEIGMYACASIPSVTLPSTISMMDSLSLMDVGAATFTGKTRAEALAIANFPWGMADGSVVHCSDGDVILGRQITGPILDTKSGENDSCWYKGGYIYFTEAEETPIYCDFNNGVDGAFFVFEDGTEVRLIPNDTSVVDHKQFLLKIGTGLPTIAEGETMQARLEIRTQYGVEGGALHTIAYPNPITIWL